MRRTNMPGLGFIWLVVVTTFAISFFIFANSSPPLSEVWSLSKSLKIGSISDLNHKQRDLFITALKKDKKLQQEIASKKGIDILSCNYDGQLCGQNALLLRVPSVSKSNKVLFDILSSNNKFPYDIKVSGKTWSRKVRVTATGKHVITMPKAKEIEFINLTVFHSRKFLKNEMPGIDVSFKK